MNSKGSVGICPYHTHIRYVAYNIPTTVHIYVASRTLSASWKYGMLKFSWFNHCKSIKSKPRHRKKNAFFKAFTCRYQVLRDTGNRTISFWIYRVYTDNCGRLPGQDVLAHVVFSVFSPKQSLPPWDGAGLSQSRDLIFVPPPHEVEQLDHADQSSHSPFTSTKIQIHQLLDKTILKKSRLQ